MSDANIDQALLELTTAARGKPGKTQHVEAGVGVLGKIPQWLADRNVRDHVVICDQHTAQAAGQELTGLLKAQGHAAQIHIIDPQPGEDHVVCDDGIIDQTRAVLAAHPSVNAIAVGAGTINDIVKMATHRLEREYQSVATAASMNGYTSAIAAVLSKGVKRTLPTHQALAVFADVDIIAKAPPYLNQAGFGDLLSKPYSNADWLLSHLVRGVPYAKRPAELLDEAYEALLEKAPRVGNSELDGIGTLTRTILLSGFTMAIAGTSAPASGGEHLVSHYWDMEQHCNDASLFALHGTQVGIATRMSAMLFEKLVELPSESIDADAAAAARPDQSWLDELAQAHPRLTPAVREEVRDQIAAKQKYGAALREELADVAQRWEEIRAQLRAILKPSAAMSLALIQAGAPDRPSSIGVDTPHAVRTLRVCRQIRGRYVGLDLIDDLGLLHGWAAQVVGAVEG